MPKGHPLVGLTTPVRVWPVLPRLPQCEQRRKLPFLLGPVASCGPPCPLIVGLDWAGLTLPVCRVGRVGVVESLLALPDGSSQGEVSLHHPFLVAVEHRLAGHGE